MVNHQTFDWIFFAIVGIPFVLGLIQLLMPDWLERFLTGLNHNGIPVAAVF